MNRPQDPGIRIIPAGYRLVSVPFGDDGLMYELRSPTIDLGDGLTGYWMEANGACLQAAVATALQRSPETISLPGLEAGDLINWAQTEGYDVDLLPPGVGPRPIGLSVGLTRTYTDRVDRGRIPARHVVVLRDGVLFFDPAMRFIWPSTGQPPRKTQVSDIETGRHLQTERTVMLSEIQEAPIDGEPTKAPATLEDAAGVGTIAWSNPGKAIEPKTSEGASATLKSGETSHYLEATNLELGSVVAEGATIRGVGLSFFGTTSVEGFDNAIRLVIGGAVKTPNKASTDFWATNGKTRFYGGLGDLWEQTSITRANVVASNFGVAISVKSPFSASIIEVANLRVAVWFTEAGNDTAICFANRSVELRTDGVSRQGSFDDVGQRHPGRLSPLRHPRRPRGSDAADDHYREPG